MKEHVGNGIETYIVTSRKSLLHQITLDWLDKYNFSPFITDISPYRLFYQAAVAFLKER